MKITSDIPELIVEAALASGIDLSRVAKEALLIELFRRNVIDHAALRESLGLSILEVDAILKERRIPILWGTSEEETERNRPMIQTLHWISEEPVAPDEPPWEAVEAAINKRRGNS